MHKCMIDTRRLDRLHPGRDAGIHAGHPSPARIMIDHRTWASTGQRHGITADAAAQVQHRRITKSGGLPRRDRLARGLFQTGSIEHQRARVGELAGCPSSSASQFDRFGHWSIRKGLPKTHHRGRRDPVGDDEGGGREDRGGLGFGQLLPGVES